MTPQQQRLLEKAQRSLQAAKRLSAEGDYDFSVSRGYYAMFYLATAFLEGEGLSYSKHSAVIGIFGERFAKTKRIPVEFHRYLIDAQRIRTTADYDLASDILEADAFSIISKAEEMLDFAINNIDSLPPPSP